MLRLRQEQMDALSALSLDEANRRMVSYARQRFPSEFGQSDAPTLSAFVREVRDAARKHGIANENDVATFLDFTVMYGADFPEADWAEDIMTCAAFPGPDKMAMLRSRVEETGVEL